MAITYTWSIIDMERQITMGDKSDVITQITYKLDGTETVDGTEYTGSMSETVSVELGSQPFQAFSSVTEADAIQWVKDKLGADGIANSELNVSNQITESQTPITANGVSW